MNQKVKLKQKAINDPGSLRFTELCSLAEDHGFEKRQGKGSHVRFVRKGFVRRMCFQNEKGNAIRYQVKQLLDALEELGELDD